MQPPPDRTSHALEGTGQDLESPPVGVRRVDVADRDSIQRTDRLAERTVKSSLKP